MQITKIGHHLGVQLPDQLVEQAGFSVGDEVHVTIGSSGDQLIVTPAHGQRERAFARLQARQWAAQADYHFDREDANTR